MHASGGLEMMRAGAKALAESVPAKHRAKLIAVTILTSLDQRALRQIGVSGTPRACVTRLARLTKRAGLDGVVASPQEIKAIRRACGKDFLIVVPGVRPAQDGKVARRDDQARVATPGQTIRDGADYLVIGRPITAAPDPRAAAEAILAEMSEALDSHRS
jgi:orotidine-5'-phosphate decarboxylase